MDAITLLKDDHRSLERLFKRYEQAGDRAFVEKRALVDRIIEELSRHAAIEEQLFYPVARATVPGTDDIALESLEEHHIVKWVLSELERMDPTDERFDAKVTVLIENVRHHVEEESEFFPKVRDELGRMLEGGVNGCPVLDSQPPGAHPRAEYYINFQDPAGPPLESPLVVDGHEWLKIGWEGYDAGAGYGWSGPFIGDPSIMLYQYLSDAPVSELSRSIIYNDYGRTDTFNWDIENGRYEVTVSIGFDGRDYAMQRVVVEGQALFDPGVTTPAAPYVTGSVTVDVTDGNVTLEAGQTDEYTMLNWMSIVPVQ